MTNKTVSTAPGEDDTLGFQVGLQTLLYLIKQGVVVLKSFKKACKNNQQQVLTINSSTPRRSPQKCVMFMLHPILTVHLQERCHGPLLASNNHSTPYQKKKRQKGTKKKEKKKRGKVLGISMT